jgi:aminocarboxymuconate-semialdehyde decarboxylase
MVRKIDFHNHIYPLSYVKQLERKCLLSFGGFKMVVGPSFYDLKQREHDARSMGVDMVALTIGPPGVDPLDHDSSCQTAVAVNDEIASIVEKSPDKYTGLACLPLQDIGRSLEEMDRAVKDLRLKGAIIFSNVRGKMIDAEEFWPIYERASSLDIPLFLHPTQPLNPENFKDLAILIGVGFLFDTTLATVRIVFSGVLQKYPGLKIVLAHLGSTIPYIIERIDIETKLLRSFFPDTNYGLPKPPSHYLKKIYIDTVSHQESAYRLSYEIFGPERIVLGSDYPYSTWRRTTEEIEELRFPRASKNKIFGENAEKLLKIG